MKCSDNEMFFPEPSVGCGAKSDTDPFVSCMLLLDPSFLLFRVPSPKRACWGGSSIKVSRDVLLLATLSHYVFPWEYVPVGMDQKYYWCLYTGCLVDAVAPPSSCRIPWYECIEPKEPTTITFKLRTVVSNREKSWCSVCASSMGENLQDTSKCSRSYGDEHLFGLTGQLAKWHDA